MGTASKGYFDWCIHFGRVQGLARNAICFSASDVQILGLTRNCGISRLPVLHLNV